MNKDERNEIKELLKERNLLLERYVKSCEKSDNVNNSIDINIIYKNARNNISVSIYDFDKKLLEYVKESPVGEWLMQIKGMTFDIAAGLLAYFDIENKECSAQFIKYSGSDNCSSPHNIDVRNLIDKLDENFKSQPDSLYYKCKMDKYIKELTEGNTEESSKIKADRYMRKIFVSHLFEEMYREAHNGKPPKRHNDRNCIIIEPEVPYTK